MSVKEQYTFIMIQCDGTEVQLKGNKVGLRDILDDFKSFLKGCTFSDELVDRIEVMDELEEKLTSPDTHYGGNCY